jgi:hypothetical protein
MLTAVALFAALEFPLSTPVIQPAPFGRANPHIASNGDGFLAAWADYRTNRVEIRAARLDHDVNLVDPTGIRIAANSGASLSVASDGRDYVIAYDCNGDLYYTPSICTARVDAATGEVTAGVRINGGVSPAIAFNGRSYVVAFGAPNVSFQKEIDAIAISRDAAASGQPFRVGAGVSAPALTSNGDVFLAAWSTYGSLQSAVISDRDVLATSALSSFVPQSGPGPFGWALASNGRDFMVVWQQNVGVRDRQYVTELRSRPVSATGSAGEERTVAADPERTWQPAITWTGADYIVTYTMSDAPASAPVLSPNADADIRGVQLASSGELVGAPHSIAARTGRESGSAGASNGDRTVIVNEHMYRFAAGQIEARSTHDLQPILLSRSVTWQQAVSGARDLVAWEELVDEQQRRQVFYQHLNQAGMTRGAAVRTPPDDVEQFNPVVSDHLIAWIEQPVNSTTALGEVWIKAVAADAIKIGMASHNSGVALAESEPGALVAWMQPPNQVVALRVLQNGVVVDREPFVIFANAPFFVSDPVVGSDGTDFLVTWRMSEPRCMIECVPPTSIHGAVVSSSGTVTPENQIAPAGTSHQSVIWNGQHYVVVWSGIDWTISTPQKNQVKVRRLTVAGTVFDADPIPMMDDVAFSDAVWTGHEYLVAFTKGPIADLTTLSIAHFGRDFAVGQTDQIAAPYVAYTRIAMFSPAGSSWFLA